MNAKFSRAIPTVLLLAPLGAGLLLLKSAWAQNSSGAQQGAAQILRGEGSFNDWSNERPGNRYLIKPSDLPKPYATESDANQSKEVPRPANACPQVPHGFTID